MKHKILLLYSYLVRSFLFFFPDIPFIMRFRGFLYSIFMKKRGSNFQVAASSIIKGIENISIEENCFFASNTIIDASTYIFFGKDVMVGYSTIIVTGNHTLKNNSYRFGPPIREPIKINHGTWIGANCVILSGVTIPSASCIAAGTVINKKLDKSGVYYRHSTLKYKG
ncbi:hypothetical protein BBX45_03630 [Proteus mirabilis]|uniref:acyltransferase n=1 Tax=Proteus mirabilis TaxID=584 RepID=UPI0008DC8612|nr:acyltransferase [Proteus mirabilis]MBG3116100.1 acyltransferase [Proteus mirabilis]MDM3574839.1 acyltransferase [Proteus mirabilis]MDZ7490043.1 acyltransferase [Proteus mirabilis]OHY45288.1 hypothetical protein BBX45_03630 [Proteus mirabilis]